MYATPLGQAPPARWLQLPFGEAGTWATVNALRGVVREATRSPIVQDTARAIGAGNPYQLREWLAAHFRFRFDPPDYEAVWTPADQLAQIVQRGYAQGDCDDAAVLSAALARAAGVSPVRFVLLGFERRGLLSHIYTEAAGIELDVTRPHQRTAPVQRRAVVEV